MRNPYMKFQNPSFKFFLNGRTNEQTNKRTSRKQAPHFFKVGGIIEKHLIYEQQYEGCPKNSWTTWITLCKHAEKVY